MAVIKCTACDHKLDTSDKDSVFRHVLINTLVCHECFKLYGDGDFTKYADGIDEDGDDNYCRWCADGGDLFICCKEGCHYAFCDRCIKRNLGEKAFAKVSESENWSCFACDQKQISKLIKFADKVLVNLKNVSMNGNSQNGVNSARKSMFKHNIGKVSNDDDVINVTNTNDVTNNSATPKQLKPEHRAKKSTSKPCNVFVNPPKVNINKDEINDDNKESTTNKGLSSEIIKNLFSNKNKSNGDDVDNAERKKKLSEKRSKKKNEDKNGNETDETSKFSEDNDNDVIKDNEINDTSVVDVFDEDTYSEDDFRAKLNEKVKKNRNSVSITDENDIDVDQNKAEKKKSPKKSTVNNKRGKSPDLTQSENYFELSEWIDKSGDDDDHVPGEKEPVSKTNGDNDDGDEVKETDDDDDNECCPQNDTVEIVDIDEKNGKHNRTSQVSGRAKEPKRSKESSVDKSKKSDISQQIEVEDDKDEEMDNVEEEEEEETKTIDSKDHNEEDKDDDKKILMIEKTKKRMIANVDDDEEINIVKRKRPILNEDLEESESEDQKYGPIGDVLVAGDDNEIDESGVLENICSKYIISSKKYTNAKKSSKKRKYLIRLTELFEELSSLHSKRICSALKEI